MRHVFDDDDELGRALRELVENGEATVEERDGERIYTITEKGKARAEMLAFRALAEMNAPPSEKS